MPTSLCRGCWRRRAGRVRWRATTTACSRWWRCIAWTRVRAALASALADGEYSVRAMQAALALPVVAFAGLRFGNLNTPDDLAAAGCAPE